MTTFSRLFHRPSGQSLGRPYRQDTAFRPSIALAVLGLILILGATTAHAEYSSMFSPPVPGSVAADPGAVPAAFAAQLQSVGQANQVVTPSQQLQNPALPVTGPGPGVGYVGEAPSYAGFVSSSPNQAAWQQLPSFNGSGPAPFYSVTKDPASGFGFNPEQYQLSPAVLMSAADVKPYFPNQAAVESVNGPVKPAGAANPPAGPVVEETNTAVAGKAI